MIEQLIEYDKKLFLWLNSFHWPWLDPVMLYVSETWIWLPLHIFLLYHIYKEYPKQVWLVLIAMAVTIVISDQVTTNIMKPYFERLRPTHDPTVAGMVHIVDGYKGGRFGFASSHAANTFALATFFFLLFSKTKKWIGWLFLWALVVTYSRIYLGVHYPGDVLVGAIVGVMAAFAGNYSFVAIDKLISSRRNRSTAGE